MLQIALLQMTDCGLDQAAALEKGTDFCRCAKALGADIALFPELWNIGYTSFVPDDVNRGDVWRAPELWPLAPRGGRFAYGGEGEIQAARAQWQSNAIETDSPFVTHFRALAQELNMAIALTYLQAWPIAPRNAVSLIDRHGEIAFTYAKVHTCDFDYLEAACMPGDDFHVAALDTEQGLVAVGAMICYDREFPESARVLMLKGAELILAPNSCDLEINRLSQLRARASENMVGVALANYAGPNNFGHSVAYDGVAFGKNGSRDMTIVEAGEEEGVFMAALDLDALRDYRRRESWGNAFRRPRRYGLLTSPVVLPPFVRMDEHGERWDMERR
ncbi:MAG: carbon-nitrogen hydrolase family protein [Anaerolineales bacterium]